jgi:hypothetical protein
MQRLEKSRWAFRDKQSTIYSKHTPVPVWVVLKSKDNSIFQGAVQQLLEAQAKYMPWPGLFVVDAANYLREEGYSHRLPEPSKDIMELSESVSLMLLQEVMMHFNEVCRVSDDPVRSYNNVDLVVKEAYDYARVLDYLVNCQDGTTLSCMFDTQRTDTKVYFTVVHDISEDYFSTLRTMSSKLLLISDTPKDNLIFDDTLIVNAENADTSFEFIVKHV